MTLLYKHQIEFLEKVGGEFTTTEASKVLRKRGRALGGFLSSLMRGKHIKPMYRITRNNTLWKKL